MSSYQIYSKSIERLHFQRYGDLTVLTRRERKGKGRKGKGLRGGKKKGRGKEGSERKGSKERKTKEREWYGKERV